MTYKEFSILVNQRIKKGDSKIIICQEYGIYLQKLSHYLSAAKKNPDKLVPVELYAKLKELK